MAKFNDSRKRMIMETTGGNTKNLAGGQAFSLNIKEELLSILLTSFISNQYYRDTDETIKKMISLIETCDDKRFIAKAAIYARDVFGMRSVSHVVAGELARLVHGEQWTARFFDKIVVRPDDMLEIMSYFSKYGKKNDIKNKIRGIPNALKKGFRSAIGRFDEYQLAKYRGEGKDFKLIDLINLIHPKPTLKNKNTISLIVKNELRSTKTWESMLSQAGQKAESSKELNDLKKEAWIDLVLENKLPYFALVRNLRNILMQAPSIVDDVANMLVNETAILKSRLFPFRFFSAYEELRKSCLGGKSVIMDALSEAALIACRNVPEFKGKTLIVLDVSGSMTSSTIGGEHSTVTPAVAGLLIAMILANVNTGADVMFFHGRADYVNVKKYGESFLNSVSNVARSFNGGSTNFNSIFTSANKAYDRIIILSDMQGWVGYYSPSVKGGVFDQYRKKFNCNPFVYSIDLCGYGSSQFDPSNNKAFMISGFSEKIFNVMKFLEEDRQALIFEIEKIEL